MKKLLIVLATVLAIVNINAEELVGTRSLDHFDKISATNGTNVLLRNSTEEKVEVRVENGLLSDITTEVTNGTLKVKMKPQINKDISVVVIVYYKDLRSISANTGATIKTKDLLITELLDISAYTGAEVEAEIQCTDVKILSTGGAEVKTIGWCERLEATTKTGGLLDAQGLKADRVLAKAATGASLWAYPIDYLEASANTTGKIYYINAPAKMTEKISSGGEIIKNIKATVDS